MKKNNINILIYILAVFLLPEYISVILLIPLLFIFFKQNKISLTKIQKTELLLMLFMLLSTFWSSNKLITLGISLLMIFLFSFQLIIYNLVNKENYKDYIYFFIQGLAIVSFVALLQYIFKLIPNPIYKDIDSFIYTFLPINIQLKTFISRSCGTFNNPNILAYILVLSLPLAIYLIISDSANRKKKIINILNSLLIIIGIFSTKSRISILCVLVTLFIVLFIIDKKYKKNYLFLIIVLMLTSLYFLFDRFNIHSFKDILNMFKDKSINTHLLLWKSSFNYLNNNILSLFIGNGSSVETTHNIMKLYNINQPHTHNLLIEFLLQIGIIGSSIFYIALFNIIKLCKNIKNNKVFYIYLSIIISFILINITDFYFVTPKQMICIFFIIGLLEKHVFDCSEV